MIIDKDEAAYAVASIPPGALPAGTVPLADILGALTYATEQLVVDTRPSTGHPAYTAPENAAQAARHIASSMERVSIAMGHTTEYLLAHLRREYGGKLNEQEAEMLGHMRNLTRLLAHTSKEAWAVAGEVAIVIDPNDPQRQRQDAPAEGEQG